MSSCAQQPLLTVLFPCVCTDEIEQMAFDFFQRLIFDAKGQLGLSSGEKSVIETQKRIGNKMPAQSKRWSFRDRNPTSNKAGIGEYIQVLRDVLFFQT